MHVLSTLVGAALAALGAGVAAAPREVVEAQAKREVRLGYFANVTHATAMVGIERGEFAAALGDGAGLRTFTFNAGPSAIESLLSGAIDATYIGPNPAINAFVKSRGQAVRVVCGATSGGAFLVVDPSIAAAADLKGRKLATPQLGNTQDVALRAWLKAQGFRVALAGANDVAIVPQENAQTLEAFKRRQIAGAWVPEPWATRLILEGGGKVLVDERDLWPDGRFVTTHLLVSAEFLVEEPELVRALLRGHLAAEAWLLAHPTEAQALVNGAIAKITGKKLAEATIQGAWQNLEFTHDPVQGSLVKSALDAQAAGLVDLGGIDVAGIYDLRPLEEVLAEATRAASVRGAR